MRTQLPETLLFCELIQFSAVLVLILADFFVVADFSSANFFSRILFFTNLIF